MSPTARSLKHLREAGCVADVCEFYNSFTRRRHDLFKVLDIVALSPDGETIGVQTTSGSNVSARVKKIADCEALVALRRCGWKIVCHGWTKGSNGRYRLREVDCS